MKYRDAFEEYINSDEFKIDEINRLKRKKNMQDDYIKEYIKTAYNFIEFYSSWRFNYKMITFKNYFVLNIISIIYYLISIKKDFSFISSF